MQSIKKGLFALFLLLLFGAHAHAQTLASSCTNETGGSGQSATLTCSVTLAANEFVVAAGDGCTYSSFLTCTGGVPPFTISDSKSLTWTSCPNASGTFTPPVTGGTSELFCWYAATGSSSGSDTVTLGTSPSTVAYSNIIVGVITSTTTPVEGGTGLVHTTPTSTAQSMTFTPTGGSSTTFCTQTTTANEWIAVGAGFSISGGGVMGVGVFYIPGSGGITPDTTGGSGCNAMNGAADGSDLAIEFTGNTAVISGRHRLIED